MGKKQNEDKSTTNAQIKSKEDRDRNPEIKPKKQKTGGRKKGTPKTGGRKKGTPNKSTSNFKAILESYGFDLPEQIAKMYFDEKTNIEAKIRLIELVARHTQPVPKPVDQNGDDKQVIEINYTKAD